MFGGVDESDVWKKIEELDADYRNVFKLQNQIYKLQLSKLKQTKVSSQKPKRASPKPHEKDQK